MFRDVAACGRAMKVWVLSSAMLVVGGCGGETPQPSIPPPPMMPAPAATFSLDFAPASPTPASETSTVSATCTGADFNLDTLLASGECTGKPAMMRADPSPEALEISVGPRELDLAPGASVPLTVTMKNISSEHLMLNVNLTCGKDDSFAPEVRNKAGKDLQDRAGCGTKKQCVVETVTVRLSPGGQLTTKVDLEASSKTFDGCTVKSKKPLKPGTYEVRVRTPFTQVSTANAAGQSVRFGTLTLRVKQ